MRISRGTIGAVAIEDLGASVRMQPEGRAVHEYGSAAVGSDPQVAKLLKHLLHTPSKVAGRILKHDSLGRQTRRAEHAQAKKPMVS